MPFRFHRHTARVGLGILLALVLVLPGGAVAATKAGDGKSSATANAASHGEFVGTITMGCVEETVTVDCSVNFSSLLCFEAVAGTNIGGECSVSFSGTISGVGKRSACAGFGDASGSVNSVAFGGMSHSGVMTQGVATGSYQGIGGNETGNVIIEAEWATPGCTTGDIDGIATGSFNTYLNIAS